MRHPNLLLAVVNPLSGERSAAAAVHDSFVASLGAERVIRLDGAIFKDPSGLKARLQQAAQSHSARFSRTSPSGGAGGSQAEPLSPGVRRKGTVLVAGGDGTVAFVMNIVQDAFATAVGDDDTARGGMDDVDDTLAHLLATGAASTSGSPDRVGSPVAERDAAAARADAEEAVPAVAVFPMGTGNDLSFTLGFGLGFTRNHCCAACVCLPQDIDAIVDATLAAPMVRFDRWEATVHRVASNTATAGPVIHRVGFNNYVSLGMDADIARRFDESRKAWPSMHRLRTMNKLWYGVHGLTATPFAPKFSNKNLAMTIDSTGVALPSSANNCKAIVITNVLGYSGGVDLWRMKNPELVELPRAGAAGGFENRRVPLQPGAVGDGRLEVQTLGGLFHMTFLRSGFVGADRVGQGSTIDVVVSDPDGTNPGIRLQADGEPLGEFKAPFRIQVRPAPRGPLYVHCAPSSKAAARSATSSVAY